MVAKNQIVAEPGAPDWFGRFVLAVNAQLQAITPRSLLAKLPVYATNAAAVTAGLQVGDPYYNSTVGAISLRQ